jgi:hypothetical protein
MQTLLYINLNQIQETIYDSIYQSILIDDQIQIIVVLEDAFIHEFKNVINLWNVKTTNVFCVTTESLYNNKISSIESYFSKFKLTEFRNSFWENTTKRFLYIEAVMKALNLTNVYHIENDVMIYFPLTNLNTSKLILLRDSKTRVIGSIIYIKNKELIQKLVDFILSKIKNLNVFLNDMDLLGSYTDAEYFNTFPETNKTVYDGACLGQYLGGIDYNNLQNSITDEIIYSNGLKGFINETSELKPDKYTFRLIDGKYYINNSPIMNLHIHSKMLFNFSSFKINYNDIITGDRVLSLTDYTFSTKAISSFHKYNQEYNNHTFIVNDFKIIDMNIINDIFDKTNKNTITIFIYTHILDLFIEYILPFLTTQKMFVIYLHNSDHVFDEKYLNLVNHVNIKFIYAQNLNLIHKKVSLLPIGIANKMWPHGNLNTLYKSIITTFKLEKRLNVYININPATFVYRKELLDELIKQKCICNTNKKYSEYLNELSSHYFCLCPRGNGIDSHRFWESIYLKVVPIIINNKYTQCNAFVRNLEKLNIPFYEIKYENTVQIIKTVLSLNKTHYSQFLNKNWKVSLDQFQTV